MRLSLGAKFTLIVLTILAATMTVNMLYFLNTASEFHEKQFVERGRALGRLIALVSPDAILGFDFLLLNDYTREVSSQPDVVYGVILSAQGQAISSYVNDSDPLIRKSLDAAKLKDIPNLLKKLEGEAGLIQLDFPITHNEVLLGRFLVGISRASLQSEFRQQLIIQLLVLTNAMYQAKATGQGSAIFFNDEMNNQDDVMLVKSILAMAKGLDLKVVAEGVENRDQLRFLTEQGCDFCQGYFLAMPLPEADFRGYLQDPQAGVEPRRPSATRKMHRGSTS